MIRTVKLHGALESLGPSFELDVDRPRELYSALINLVPGFRQEIIKNPQQAVILQHGDELNPVSPETLDFTFGPAEQVHIFPVPEGSGVEVIAAIGTYFGVGTIAATAIYVAISVAVSLVIGAVIQALSPQPDGTQSTRKKDDSFIFNGPINVTGQGTAIPLVYGTHMTGSIVISAGVEVVEIEVQPEQSSTTGSGGGSVPTTNPPPVDYQWDGYNPNQV